MIAESRKFAAARSQLDTETRRIKNLSFQADDEDLIDFVLNDDGSLANIHRLVSVAKQYPSFCRFVVGNEVIPISDVEETLLVIALCNGIINDFGGLL